MKEKAMDGSTDIHDDAAVIVVENEVKSLPVLEEGPTMRQSTLHILETCPVCHLNFNSREPKLLPCLHSFCIKCLPSPSRNLAMPDPSANSQFDSVTKPLNVIRCPVCRQECMEVDVMENLFVKDSGEASSSTVERTTVQLCMSCEDNTEATGFCVDCVEFLCVTCVEAHQRVKFTKDHRIRQKEEVAEEGQSVTTQRPVFCDIHKQEPLKLFCETCDLLTCRDCQLLKHKDHNYQFLEDAYKNLKQHMEKMTRQLQEKKKVIEDMANSIDNGLCQVDENRTLVHNEIKKSICSLILEINRKGKILVNQLEALTKDNETVLKKQKEDIGYLSRHLDHVINFTSWATDRNGGTALLYCKRLILFQIGNLLRAKCNTSFVPQSTLRFQCRSGFWASNVDLGSLVVENVPGHQLGGSFQGIPQQLSHLRQGPSGSPSGLPQGSTQARLAPHNTLAQLQLQVEKLAQQPHWQPQPPPPPWSWYQNMRLQRPPQGPQQGGSPSQTFPPMSQPGRRFIAPPSNHLSPTGSLPSPGFASQTVQPLREMMSSSSYQSMEAFQPTPLHSHSAPLLSNGSLGSPHSQLQMESLYLTQRNETGGPILIIRPSFTQSIPPSLLQRNAHGRQNSLGFSAVSREEKPGTISWRPPETQTTGAQVSAAKRRRRSSPGPIIVIKDEPEETMCHANQRANLPDSTGDQAPSEDSGEPIQTHPNPSQDKNTKTPPQSQETLGGSTHTDAPQQADKAPYQAPGEDPNEDWCAVCQNGGKLLCCEKCPKVFHLTCHIPTLVRSPSSEWVCSLCRDPSLPEMENDCNKQLEAKAVKEEPHTEGGFSSVDRRKCEKLLLELYCSELSADFQNTPSPQVVLENTLTVKKPMNLAMVKTRLETTSSPEYHSPAEFVSDIRLIFRNCAALKEPDSEVATAGKNLERFFEKQLKILYPDRTFPEVKTEVVSPVTPPVSPPSTPEVARPAKQQSRCSEHQDSCSQISTPREEKETA